MTQYKDVILLITRPTARGDARVRARLARGDPPREVTRVYTRAPRAGGELKPSPGTRGPEGLLP